MTEKPKLLALGQTEHGVFSVIFEADDEDRVIYFDRGCATKNTIGPLIDWLLKAKGWMEDE